MGRFEREIGLLGEDGLNRLFASKVAVIGLGGVGGSCAIALARSGVGRLLLLDGDVVEESNLNRQTLFGYSDLGRRKAEAAKEALSPYCGSIEAFDAYLDEGNIDSFPLEGCDFLLDCIDDNGILQKCSYGTPMGRETQDFYREIPIHPMPYGQAMAMLFFMESRNFIA